MKSGIYKITCAASHKIYIGSATNLKYRIRRHFIDLKRNNHCSRYLQAAFNKYGRQSFFVEIVEYVSADKLLKREQYYLDTLNCCNREIGFNTCPVAGAPHKRKLSEEQRKRIGDALRGRKRSAEVIERVRQGLIGRKMPKHHIENQRRLKTGLKQTEENIAKRAKNFSLIGPDGTIYHESNLKRFCEKHGLHRYNINKVLSGERKQHHKFRRYEI